MGDVARGAICRRVDVTLAKDVVRRLRVSRGPVSRVTRTFRFPSLTAVAGFFGERAKGAPARCEGDTETWVCRELSSHAVCGVGDC